MKSSIKKILFVTLSNIGDVILTLPVLDSLIANYPDAKVTALCGPRSREIFEDNPNILRLIIYDKHSSIFRKVRLFNELNASGFDMVVDLRNTVFGICLFAKYRINPFIRIPKAIKHAKDRHLFKVKGLVNNNIRGQKRVLNIRDEDREHITRFIKEGDRLLVVAPGARSSTKRWEAHNFKRVIENSSDIFPEIVLVGDEGDISICEVVSSGAENVLNLCAKTSLRQLAVLLKRASLLITNDSAVMHLASYLNCPVLAIFGPTDDKRYGPWSDKCMVLRKHLPCSPCQKAQCQYGTLECLKSIGPDEVIDAVKKFS